MSLFGKRRIFLDYAAGEDNPSGIHKEGVEAKRRLESARLRIARVLECQARDIIFTSGGTEADNLAVLGVFEASRERFERPHIIVSEHEHPAVLEAAKEAERRGAELSVVPVEEIVSSLRENTVLVSLMYANNETGALNPVPKLARQIAAERKRRGSRYPYIHTDASQAALYLPVDISRLGVDLMTLDASKVYGPKSAGLLVVRPNVAVRPILMGGGQERGLRAGTENIASAARFAEALEEASRNRDAESQRLESLKRIFLSGVREKLPEAVVNTPDESLPNIVSLTFPGLLHEFLAVQLDERGVSVSTGSSCSSSKDERDKEAVRFSFGKDTTEKEAREALKILLEIRKLM